MSVLPKILAYAVAEAGPVLYFCGSQLPLPPGPPGLPVIGNLLQAPKEAPWKKYKEWSNKYGPIMSIRNGQNVFIIITSFDIVKDFLEKNNSVFSSRPHLVVIERASGGLATSFLPYGPQWNSHRLLRGNVLKPAMAVKYRPVLDTESKQMLHEVLSMNNLPQTLRRQAASTFLTIAYGYRLPVEPPEIQEMEELVSYMATISEACFRGTSVLAEFFPFAQYLPGNSWWKEEADKIAAKLTRFYVQKWRAGLETSAWNWTKEYNVHKEAQPMDELERAYTIGSIYEASLTPFEILLIVILAALYNPEETRRIQRAIDAVVGGANRMPESSDMAQLPQILFFVHEALRWRPFSPLAAPRAVSKEVEYQGYRIPKGATIVVNQWAMDHDENIFADPFKFRYSRWEEKPDLPHISFGFGLRGCPGQHLAREYLFISVARLLWAFDFNHPTDLEKLFCPRTPIAFFNQVPYSFKVDITPRDEKREALIEREWEGAEKDVNVLLDRVMPLPN
ncbi:cytochrome P450 [Aspergillus novofumigatus IBT 16806]|uniref:Cytochrome P450 n=1 Tax=Aspergillus novofumigatus (strain IBT 16806) TaxID=1392255 RepID=A0A2I1CB10_ASPN1|nr:cytochrome P450 [Aspergillus novofumigatus IBT 16806]PKX94818.1 cytochrome P450 [Aspergillus novofumigatus IBT 16806]